jgi:hypothetical protein
MRCPALASELSSRWEYQTQINTDIVGRLVQTSTLVGFSGTLVMGTRVGHAALPADVPLPSWCSLHVAHPSGGVDRNIGSDAIGPSRDVDTGVGPNANVLSDEHVDNLVNYLVESSED